ncbi:MAG TPA: hypothetical protein VIG24_12500 [Acidimicrobiia bacterium]
MPKLLDPGRQITDGTTALPVASGKAYFSEPGTTTEKTVYSDDAMSVAISQPITLNSEGRFPAPPYGSGEFRLQVYDSTDTGTRDGVLIFDEDNIRGATDFSDITLTAPLKADDSTSTALPVYTFDGDLDTGIAHPAADTVAISTGGTEAARFTSAQRLGMGTTAPVTTVHAVGGVRVEQNAGTQDGATIDILATSASPDRGIVYTGAVAGRQAVLWAKETNASTIVQMNINGSAWEWSSGSLPTTPVMTLGAATGNLTITGALSKGSGTFRIPHPVTEGKDLVHSFIEGPRADLIYRGKVTLVAGEASVNLDTACGMAAGTFEALCRDPDVFLQSSGFDAVRATLSGAVLSIECQEATSTATVSWMVVAERQDDVIRGADWTDEDGRPILEPDAMDR